MRRAGGSHAAQGARVGLLGPLEVTGPHGQLRLPGGRQRALLALLALRAPEVLSRSQLVDALWGTAPPPTAIKTLHSHIARIRGALAHIGLGDLLITREPGYALAIARDRVDVNRFEEQVRAGQQALRADDPAAAAEELRAGLAVWRGDPLADCPVTDWGQVEIARLQEARADAAETLAEAELMLGEHARVAGELERLTVRHPLRERFWELLIVAYHRGGRQADALRAYRRARAVLIEELGMEPGPGLRRLEAAVLAGTAELDPTTAPDPGPAPAATTEPEPSAAKGLPDALTGLIGRERELADVLRLLGLSRIVTLTGPGGCGKTRLAIGAAAKQDLPTTLVDLTVVHNPELVADAVAAALGVAERPGIDLTDTLAETLSSRELLVVLDNCEHQVQACAVLVSRLVTACPGLRILATSREMLRVAGETGYEVPPLAVPDPDAPWTLSDLIAYDSVQLFLDRAGGRGAHPFSDADARPIAQLCAALDGLPLAIELAAARSTVLAPAQITRRLRDRFGLLSFGARTGPPHHRALRAVVAWSYDLLTPDEAALFARLGVFAGGFSVEAAEAVGGTDGTLDVLTALVAKSLVRVWRYGESTRFGMLETIGAYAIEQLRADQRAEADARGRHAEFFLTLAEQANDDPTGQRFEQLRIEHDNLREALSWFAGSPDGSSELRLATALSRYCYLTGHYRQGRQWLDRALARSGDAPPALLATAYAGAAAMALYQCDYADASRYATAGLRLAEGLGEHGRIGRLRRLLASVARERAEYADALGLYAASRDSFQACGDSSGVAYSHLFAGATAWLSGDLDAAEHSLATGLKLLRAQNDANGVASSTAYLGAVALYRGDPRRARELLDDALDGFGDLQFKEGIAWTLNLLGLVEQADGRHGEAAWLLQTSLMLHRELGDRWRQASVLEALAAVACATGEVDRAAWLLHQADHLRTAIGAPTPLVERPALAATHATVAAVPHTSQA